MKYRKILVPLDGSELAECALPFARNLAKGVNFGEIILLYVVEINITTWQQIKGVDYYEARQTIINRAQKYISGVESKLSHEDYKVKAELIESNMSVRIISDYAQENFVDLIVMATHGYTGIKKIKRLLGSVAFRVLDESLVPVLLIRPTCRS